MGKYDEAIRAYEKAIDLNPKLTLAWFNKSIALKNLRRTSEANSAFAKAKELQHKG